MSSTTVIEVSNFLPFGEDVFDGVRLIVRETVSS